MWAPLILVLIVIAAYMMAYVTSTSADANGATDVQLSASQIAQYARNVGFTGNDLTYAVAIALAESGGRTAAKGDIALGPKNGPSIGLWQIDIGQREHPEYANVDLTDPQANANAAYSIFKAAGYSFSPWSTFNNGAYVKYLQQAVAATGIPQCTGDVVSCGSCDNCGGSV